MTNASAIAGMNGRMGRLDGDLNRIFSFSFLPNEEEELLGWPQDEEIIERCAMLASDAYDRGDVAAMGSLHRNLAHAYDLHFRIEERHEAFLRIGPLAYRIIQTFEDKILEHEESHLPDGFDEGMPAQGKEYVRWLLNRIHHHPARKHVYYREYMPEHADVKDLEQYLIQETTLDPRFDDVLAMLQVGTSGNVKMEIAKNYWDEMGNGEAKAVHTTMFARALQALEITPGKIQRNLHLESVLCGNLSVMMSLYRRHFYKAIGYYGVTEYLAPFRFKHVIDAWNRNGLDPHAIEYHQLHIRIDTQHATAWLYDVIAPLVDKNPGNGLEILKGVLYRLNSSGRYLDRLMREAKRRKGLG